VKRRAFITLIGSAATWPLAARAQQPALPVLGFLHSQSPESFVEPLRGFRQGLKEAGFVEGENLTIEYRWAERYFINKIAGKLALPPSGAPMRAPQPNGVPRPRPGDGWRRSGGHPPMPRSNAQTKAQT
jgi:hypothetical protein